MKVFYCPAEITLSVIVGKWKPMIIWSLREESRRFSGIKAQLPPVAHKVLSEQLKQLEADGIVERKLNDESRFRARYALTDKGQSIYPTLISLAHWGLTYHEELGVDFRPSSDITPRVLESLAAGLVGRQPPEGVAPGGDGQELRVPAHEVGELARR